jgi:YidC/Oxa1 family membrane protein insertase
MKKLRSKKFLIYTPLILVLLSGCTRITDSKGQVLAQYLIKLSTGFSIVFKESWFTGLLVYPLAQVINFLDQYMNVLFAIIIVTIGIKLLTLTFTIKSTVASQKMQVIQPEMKKIQDKYAGKNDDRSKMLMGQEMNDLYKKHNINPFGTILITFIQLPIIFAMYQAIQRSEAVQTGTILGQSLQQTPMYGFTHISTGGWVYVVIFVLMAVFQFLSMKMPQWLAARTQKGKVIVHPGDKVKKGNTMNTVMYTSLAMILFLSINWPTAMSLYWLVSAFAQVGQTLFIQHFYIDKPEQTKGVKAV